MYYAYFKGKSLGIKFRKNGEKLYVRKLNDNTATTNTSEGDGGGGVHDIDDTNEHVMIGSEVVAVNNKLTDTLSADEVIDLIRHSPRPITVTFSTKRHTTPKKHSRSIINQVRVGSDVSDVSMDSVLSALANKSKSDNKSAPSILSTGDKGSGGGVKKRVKIVSSQLSAEDLSFQVMFGLPVEEVVIGSFSCAFYPNKYVIFIYRYQCVSMTIYNIYIVRYHAIH